MLSCICLLFQIRHCSLFALTQQPGINNKRAYYVLESSNRWPAYQDRGAHIVRLREFRRITIRPDEAFAPDST